MKKLLVLVLTLIMGLCLTACGGADEGAEPIEQKDYGKVEQEAVNVTVSKLNTEIMDSGLNTPAYDDYMVIDNDIYWYALTDAVSVYFEPVEFTGNIKKDITDTSALFMDKETYNEETALVYARLLIKANNSELTDEKIDELLTKAKSLKEGDEMINNGKGIFVGYLETESSYQYMVKRCYE